MSVSKQHRGYIEIEQISPAIVAPRPIATFLDSIGAERITSDLDRAMARPYFQLGQFPITPAFLLKATIYLVLLLIFSRYARRFMQKRVLPHTSMGPGQQYAVARVVAYAIFLAGLMVGVQSAGVNLNSLLVLGGTLGIGLGFGLQNIANNFVSGLILLAEQPIRVGDRIEVGETSGDVVRIGARSTWVRTNDNVVIIVPNAEFVSDRVTNWTLNDAQARIAVPIAVSCQSDPDLVRKVLLDVAHRHVDVLESPASDVLLAEIGDNALRFELRVWSTKQVHTPSILRSDLYFEIVRSFREHGIELPPAV